MVGANGIAGKGVFQPHSRADAASADGVHLLAAVGVPVQGVALVIGVDRILDMFRTTTNVIGDSTATVLVARLQGEAIRVVSPDEDAADASRGIEGRLEDVEPHAVEAEEAEEA